jgi:predicted NAD/FAD-binding protein
LLKLLKKLDVAVRPDDLTFAFSKESTKMPYLIYNGLSGVRGFSVPSTKTYSTAFFEIVYYTIGFIYLCIISLLHYHLNFFPKIKDITFEEFCTDYSMPRKFSREVLVPLYSGVCTCSESDILKYPAKLIIGVFLQSMG